MTHRAHRTAAPLVLLAALAASGCATRPAAPERIDGAEPEVSLEQLLVDGEEALRRGDLDAAQVSFALAVERDPENVDALYKLGAIHHEKGGFTVAESLLRAVLAANADHQGAHEALGLTMLRLERLDDAERVLTGALERRPDAWRVMNALGVINDLRARHEEAQELFTAALFVAPRSAKVANNLGYSYYLAGDYDLAERHLRDAARFDPEHVHAWSNLGLLYSRTGRHREAAAAFDRIVDTHQAANNLGYLGILQDDRALAREQLERAIQLSPSYYELANRNLAVLGDPPAAAAARDAPRESGADTAAAGDDRDTALAPSAALAAAPSVPMLSLGEEPPATVPGRDDATPDATTPSAATPSAATRSLAAVAAPTSEASTRAAARQERHARADAPRPEAARGEIAALLAFVGFAADGGDANIGALRETLRRFQETYGLESDGRVGPLTRAKLDEVVIAQTQRRLLALGYTPGDVDGRLEAQTREAIRAFQRDQSLPLSGRPDADVLERLERAAGRASDRLNSDERLDLSSRG